MGARMGDEISPPLELENPIKTVQYPDHQGRDLLIKI